MEYFLNQVWQRWQVNGARSQAEPLLFKNGWSLSLCFRARVTALVIFLMFGGGLVGVLLLQRHDPLPQQRFLFLLLAYLAIASFAAYYLGFVFRYRVIVDEGGIELRRLFLLTRRFAWEDVARFEYAEGDETIRIHSHDGKKMGLYLSLHGLSVVRRCLFVAVPNSQARAICDQLLVKNVPSWNCDDGLIGNSPFETPVT